MHVEQLKKFLALIVDTEDIIENVYDCITGDGMSLKVEKKKVSIYSSSTRCYFFIQ